MAIIERKIINSFRSLRGDIERLKEEIMDVRQKNEILNQIIEIGAQEKRNVGAISKEKTSKKRLGNKRAKASMSSKIKTVYVASKRSKLFHKQECVFVKNINKNTQVMFSSKTEAEKKGYIACKCVV